MSTGYFPSGFSSEARYVDESARSGRRRLHESNALGMGSTLTADLTAVWASCREANWDGFDALPVSEASLRNARLFLESMPMGIPAPSIGAEPDGALTLEWHHSTRRTLSVSVSHDGNLHYAALFGPSRVYGTEAFFGEAPESILELIRRTFAA